MRKNKETEEAKLERIKLLAGIKTINESAETNIFDKSKANNGVNYGIVKEQGFYYIKATTAEVINESTLDYIGGVKNKTDYKYKGYGDALKSLNFMLIDINNTHSLNERLDKDIQPEVPMDTPSGPPQAPGEEGIPQGLPPAPTPNPQPEAPTPAPAVAPEGTPTDEPQNDGLADDDSDLDEPQDSEGIDHYVGKLTSAIRDAGIDEMNEDKMKSILNSVISALPLEQMSPDERLVIARRVKRGGKKEQEKQEQPEKPTELPVEEPVAESISPLEKSTKQFKTPHDFNKEDDKKINEFIDKISGDLIKEEGKIMFKGLVIESINNEVKIVNEESKVSYTYNVSNETIQKLKSI